MAPQPKDRLFIGIGKESTRGTAVVPADYIPVKSPPTWTPHINQLADEGIRGSMVDNYGIVQGVTSGELDWGGDVYADTIGYPIAGVLGDVTTTGAGAPFTHAVGLLNSTTAQPTSYTVNFFYVAANRSLAAGQFAEVGFTFNADGLLEYTTKVIGNSALVVATPTPSFTTAPLIPVWLGAVSVGGASTLLLESGELKISRAVTPIPVIGQQDPYRSWAGKVGVEGKLTLICEDDTFITNFTGNTQPSLDLQWQQGAGAALTLVQLHMTKVAEMSARPAFGKDYVEVEVDFKAVGNTTDVGASGGYSPIKATLKNAKASGTYV